ncbi:hypothetical protein BRE01_61280 [Brevibacillus reuszeri]|uniref:Uncharacterized protein n=1 Tax=Brevibacillus reuszeri TaxID=54915 RepID=A0ABQ0TX19_9BACL|nr:hypothetical protein BRE01_61280 [Brevibacillus reuszeri]
MPWQVRHDELIRIGESVLIAEIDRADARGVNAQDGSTLARDGACDVFIV